MKVEYDPEAKAVYIYLEDIPAGGVDYTESINNNFNIDRALDGRIIGLEFLHIDSFESNIINTINKE